MFPEWNSTCVIKNVYSGLFEFLLSSDNSMEYTPLTEYRFSVWQFLKDFSSTIHVHTTIKKFNWYRSIIWFFECWKTVLKYQRFLKIHCSSLNLAIYSDIAFGRIKHKLLSYICNVSRSRLKANSLIPPYYSHNYSENINSTSSTTVSSTSR